MPRRLLLTFYSLTAVIACLSACGKKAPPPEIRMVRTEVVKAVQIGEHVTYTGEIRPRYESDLSFRVGGKLISRPVDIGALVAKDAILAQLDPSDARTSMMSARSAVTSASAELERARSDETRNRDLLERGLATRSEYVSQQTSTKTAQANLEQAQAELELRRQQLDYTTLKTDKAGVITKVSAEPGAVVNQGQAIVTVAQPDELEAVFDVAEGQIDDVRNAMTVRLATLSARDKFFTGTVREISPSADALTRTYRVKTSLKDPPSELHMGMNVSAELQLGRSIQGVLIPSTAVYTKDGGPAVWVVKQDETIEVRPVSVLRYDTNTVALSGGLQVGERVVTGGVHKLIAGQQVKLLADNRQ